MLLLPASFTPKTASTLGPKTTPSVAGRTGFPLRAVAGIRTLLATDLGTDPNGEGALTVVNGRADEGGAYGKGEATRVISLL